MALKKTEDVLVNAYFGPDPLKPNNATLFPVIRGIESGGIAFGQFIVAALRPDKTQWLLNGQVYSITFFGAQEVDVLATCLYTSGKMNVGSWGEFHLKLSPTGVWMAFAKAMDVSKSVILAQTDVLPLVRGTVSLQP